MNVRKQQLKILRHFAELLKQMLIGIDSFKEDWDFTQDSQILWQPLCQLQATTWD